jgi:phosphate transport system protein
MITDLERIGDQAADICELCEYLVGQPPLRELEHIHQLAATTTMMVTESINAFVNRDMQLAQWVIERDDAVDALFVQAKHDLIALVRSDAASGERAFDLLQVAKYYERIGDHAENIAEWVIFYITGKHKDWQVL